MRYPRVRVAGILRNEKNEVLFIEHKKENSCYWLLPGGGVDFLEDFNTSLKREFLEETGLIIEVDNLLSVSESIAPNGSRHIINFVFIVKKIGGKLSLGNEKILSNLKYIPLDEISKIKLFPNNKKEIINFIKTGYKNIEYQKNIWED